MAFDLPLAFYNLHMTKAAQARDVCDSGDHWPALA